MIIPPVGGSFRAGHRLDRILAGCPFAPLFEMKWDAMFSALVAQIQRPMRVHRPGVRSAFPADDQQIDVGQIARQIQRAEQWLPADRSEGRRVGKECVSTCRSRWSPYHSNKHNKTTIDATTNNNYT